MVRTGLMVFWHDNLIGSGPLCHQVEIFQDQQVVDFVAGGDWDRHALSQALPPKFVRLVLSSRPSVGQGKDRMVWMSILDGTSRWPRPWSLSGPALMDHWALLVFGTGPCPSQYHFSCFACYRVGYLCWSNCAGLGSKVRLGVGVAPIRGRNA